MWKFICGFGLFVFIFVLMVIGPELPECINHNCLKRSLVASNMRGCAIAAERYAEKHAGQFPLTTQDKEFRNFWGYGEPHLRGLPSTNPFTRKAEWPLNGTVKNVATARKARPLFIGVGVIEYSPIVDNNHRVIDYVVRCGDENGMTAIWRPIDRDQDEIFLLSHSQ